MLMLINSQIEITNHIMELGYCVLTGETFAKEKVWAVVGDRLILTVYFTTLSNSKVEVKWQQIGKYLCLQEL